MPLGRHDARKVRCQGHGHAAAVSPLLNPLAVEVRLGLRREERWEEHEAAGALEITVVMQGVYDKESTVAR